MTGGIYNLLWRCLPPIVWLQMRRRIAAGKEEASRQQERYGKGYQQARPAGKLIWLHAVSVGEAVGAIATVRALKALDVHLRFLVTTNTKTAAERISAVADELAIQHAYQPFDHPVWVGRFLKKWHPDAAIFLESDFWPNLIRLTKQADIPVYFASSQISERAAKMWQKRPHFAAQIFGAATHIFAVDDHQAKQFQSFSAHPLSISVEGSLKLDLAQLQSDTKFVSALTRWSHADGRLILLLASSHNGEEQLVLDKLQSIPDDKRPLLVIAPRHPERGDVLSAEIEQAKRHSQSQLPSIPDAVYLADTLGHMGSLFEAADIILLGGSFIPIGGHNPLEPASFAKPILSGPSQFKNQAAFDVLKTSGALKILSDINELPNALAALQDGQARKDIGAAGAEIAIHASAAPHRVARAIMNDLQKRDAQ